MLLLILPSQTKASENVLGRFGDVTFRPTGPFATIAEVKPSIVIRVPAGMKVLTCKVMVIVFCFEGLESVCPPSAMVKTGLIWRTVWGYGNVVMMPDTLIFVDGIRTVTVTCGDG